MVKISSSQLQAFLTDPPVWPTDGRAIAYTYSALGICYMLSRANEKHRNTRERERESYNTRSLSNSSVCTRHRRLLAECLGTSKSSRLQRSNSSSSSSAVWCVGPTKLSDVRRCSLSPCWPPLSTDDTALTPPGRGRRQTKTTAMRTTSVTTDDAVTSSTNTTPTSVRHTNGVKFTPVRSNIYPNTWHTWHLLAATSRVITCRVNDDLGITYKPSANYPFGIYLCIHQF